MVHIVSDVRKHREQAVIYVRVSSKEQEREGYSIQAQKRLLREYAKTTGFSIIRIFEDIETAKHTGRTEFNNMLAFIKDKDKCRTVLAEKTDRLYRNIKDWVTIDELKLEIHLVKENTIISPDSRSSAKFMHGIRVLMAKQFVDNLSEEVTKGMQQKARQGFWPSYAPVGYLNGVSRNGRKVIEPDSQRAPLIKRLFETYAECDCSVSRLTKIAFEAGLTRKGSGKPLARSAIHKLLKNKIYYGDFDWNGVTYSGKHEPIVSRQLWQKVQDILSDRDSSKTKRVKHDFTFSRLLKCGHCGCMMTGELKKGKYTYYHCTGYKGKCNEPYTRETVLDEQFCEFLGLLEFDPNVISNLRVNYSKVSKKKRKYHEKAVSILQADYNKLQNKLDSMYEDKLEGVITPEMFKEKAHICRQRMDELFSAIVKHESVDPAELERSIDLLELIRNAREAYIKEDNTEKRRLLKNIVSNCSWKDGLLSAEFKQPFNMIVDTNNLYEAGKADGMPSNSLFELWYP